MKNNPNHRKPFAAKAAAILLAAMITMTGCGAGAAAMTENSAAAGQTTEQAAEQSAEAQTTASQTTAASQSEMFTERDLSGEYDESQAVSVSLNGTAAEASSSSGITVDGSTVTITAEGTYIFTGTLNDGQIIVDADESAKVQIVLKDASVTSSASAALYVKSADKVFVTTAAGTSNTLANGGTFTAIDENNIDAAVFAKDDITFNGSGSLSIESPSVHSVAGKDDVKFAGGTYTITAAKHGVQANDSVRVSGADISITAGEKDGIHVSDDSDENADGYFYIADGTVTIAAGDDGIHADGKILTEGGTITVTKSYEGLEALDISIAGGEISVVASDDGLNAAGGTTAGNNTFGDDDWGGGKGFSDGGTNGSISISGGNIRITAGGDGVDSNGSVEISGGNTVVQGPSQGDTSVLDYNSGATVTGGVFIGTGGAGMAANFSSAENQCIAALNVGNQSAGSKVIITDSSGNVLAETEPALDYAVVYISTPDMAQGGTYTVTAGTYSETITLDQAVYSSIGGGMNGGMRGGMKGGMKGSMKGSQGPGGGMPGNDMQRDDMQRGDMQGGSPDATTGASVLQEEQGV